MSNTKKEWIPALRERVCICCRSRLASTKAGSCLVCHVAHKNFRKDWIKADREYSSMIRKHLGIETKEGDK
jgi:hypothetical protein